MSVTLSESEVRLYFTEIATGTRQFKVRDGNGKERLGIFRQPTPKERREGARLYKEVYDLSLEEGIRTRVQLERDFINRYSFLTERESAQLRQMEAEIKLLTKQVMKYSHEPILFKQKKEDLGKKEAEYYTLLSKRSHYYTETAEFQAESAEMFYYASVCVPDVWSSRKDFSKERDKSLVSRLILELTAFIRGFDQSTLRAIARSPLVRTRWRIANKTGNPFFGIPMQGGSTFFATPTAEWSYDQAGVCSWLMYYDDVTQAFEAPEWMLKDDDKLDEWVQRKMKEKEAERIKNLGTGARDAYDHQDVIVFGDDRDLLFGEGSPLAGPPKKSPVTGISDERTILRSKK